MKKMKINKEVYDALVEWKNNLMPSKRIHHADFDDFFANYSIFEWWYKASSGIEANNRLISIIRWVNGEDIFEVEKPKKWVVRSKETDTGGDYRHVLLYDSFDLINPKVVASQEYATKFDTKEEAQSWANAHQEVIEVEG